VLDAWQVVQGATVPRGAVVVADWRGDWIGLGVAEQLARAGHRVTLAVNAYQPGERLQQYVRDVMLAAAHRAGVDIVTTVRLYGADADSVYLQHTLSGEPVVLDDVAALVLAHGHDPVDDLLLELTAAAADPSDPVLCGVLVHGVGDCLAPRSVEEATLEALQVASAI
jgi:NADPH-dependent 2,4-dienoyl-CoA reductase/sulfur reductase-like enzyme